MAGRTNLRPLSDSYDEVLELGQELGRTFSGAQRESFEEALLDATCLLAQDMRAVSEPTAFVNRTLEQFCMEARREWRLASRKDGSKSHAAKTNYANLILR